MSKKAKIRIEKNVPLPIRSVVPPLPLEEMEIGDSFKLELEDEKDRGTVRQRLFRFQAKNPPKRFSMCSISDTTVRVFRVEDLK